MDQSIRALHGYEGTRFNLFPQPPVGPDPMPLETVELSPPAGSVGPGPSDDRMYTVFPIGKPHPYGLKGRVFGLPPWAGRIEYPAMPDQAGHFDHLLPGTPQFEAAHLYACVRFVLDIWEEYLGDEVRWHFGDSFDRLELSIIRNWPNAHMGYGFIETGELQLGNGRAAPYSLNFDVIAHEVGHAILLGLLGDPGPARMNGEFQAFHEGCCDLIALIAALHFDSVLDEVLENTSGNLDSFNRLSRFAEFSHTSQIRIANNSKTLSDFSDGWIDEHELAKPFIGAMFDLLVDVYHDMLVDQRLVPRFLEDLADLARQDVTTFRRVQMGFDRAMTEQPAGFRITLKKARDVIAKYLVELWTMIDISDRIFDQIPKLMSISEKNVTTGKFSEHLHGNMAARGIGRILPGPRLEKFSSSRFTHSSRMLKPSLFTLQNSPTQANIGRVENIYSGRRFLPEYAV